MVVVVVVASVSTVAIAKNTYNYQGRDEPVEV